MVFNPDQQVGGPVPPPEPPRNPNNPPADQQPVGIEFDKIAGDIRRQLHEKDWRLLSEREREARARTLTGGNQETQNNFMPGPLRPLVRGIIKGVTGLTESMNMEGANFPFFGLPRRASELIDANIYEHGRDRGRETVTSFFDNLVRSRIFREFKIAQRAFTAGERQTTLTPQEIEAIKKKIIAEQPIDAPEIKRQERVMEDFRIDLNGGRYQGATRRYRDVLNHVTSQGIIIEARRRRAFEEAAKRNKGRPKEWQVSQDNLESQYFPGGMTDNLLRNELLRDYLRVESAQHIVRMIEGRIPANLQGQDHHRFIEMYRDCQSLVEMTRDDIPLSDHHIEEFFDTIRDDVRADIAAACASLADGRRVPIKRRIYVAQKLGIFTMDEMREIDPNLDRYILDDAELEDTGVVARMAEWFTGIRDRFRDARDVQEEAQQEAERTDKGALTRQGADERRFSDLGVKLSPDDRTPEQVTVLRMLDDAWHRDIENDNDVYSNFDNARAKILDRWDVFPKVRITERVVDGKIKNVDEEIPGPQVGLVAIDVGRVREVAPLRAEIAREQKSKAPDWQARVQALNAEILQIDHDADADIHFQRARIQTLIGEQRLLSPEAIQQDILDTQEFRESVMHRLISTFEQDYKKFFRQLIAAETVRGNEALEIQDDGSLKPLFAIDLKKKSDGDKERVILAAAHSPYRILGPADTLVTIDHIRQGPARQKLVEAMLRGEPALQMEEEELIRIGIFSRDELDALRPEIEHRAAQ